MKSICFLAQFPPPMHGLSKAVDTLYNSRLKEKYHFSKIDITNNKRILKSLVELWKCKSDVVYFYSFADMWWKSSRFGISEDYQLAEQEVYCSYSWRILPSVDRP